MTTPDHAQLTKYLTDKVKSPGLLLLGLARKLPSNPRSISSCSASIPLTFGWNHLKIFKFTHTCKSVDLIKDGIIGILNHCLGIMMGARRGH